MLPPASLWFALSVGDELAGTANSLQMHVPLLPGRATGTPKYFPSRAQGISQVCQGKAASQCTVVLVLCMACSLSGW